MRTLKRNLKPIYVCLYQGKTEITDSDGNYTGETTSAFSNPILIYANVQKITGRVMAEQYGLDEGYDRVAIFDNVELAKIDGFNEQSALYIDKLPTFDENDEPILNDGEPENDYIVKSVSTTLNSTLVLCKRVDFSE